MMETLRVALDWTPNTNHTGFYVASELGYYAATGIELTLLTPDADNYALTPAKKLQLGEADLALAPFESVISLNTKANPVRAVAVAAILQEDLSAIVTLTDRHVSRPRELDGRTYASYKARYEDAIVRQLVINDGGEGNLLIGYPDKLGIWNTLLTNVADSTWIFDNWEGVEAETNQIALTKFRLADYGVPYAYSPVLLTTQAHIDTKAELLRRFLDATRQGFLFAQANVAESADLLAKYVPERDRNRIDLLASQTYTSAHYGEADSWGRMDPQRIQPFIDWLFEQGLETQPLVANQLFTNELLPA